MLNFIYWPISAVLWFWHWLLSLVMDPSWGITWMGAGAETAPAAGVDGVDASMGVSVPCVFSAMPAILP